MAEDRDLVPRAILFGRVVLYECTACGQYFWSGLLAEAVPASHAPPSAVRGAFQTHVCRELEVRRPLLSFRGFRRNVIRMVDEGEDIPATYLLYAIGLLVAIAVAALVVSVFIFR